MTAVEVRGLRKQYGELAAVDDLSFTIGEGEIFALLGPNGAGKTTTVEILEGHRQRTAGEVQVLGHDPQTGGRDFRERIGIVLQEAGFDEELSVRELIEMQRGLYPRRLAVDDVIDQVGLTEKRDARVKTLSGGQRRRLDDRVAIVVRGRLVTLGTPAELATGQHAAVLSFRLPPDVTVDELPPLGGVPVADGVEWELTTVQPTAALHTLTGWALSVRRPSLEDVYLGLVADHDPAVARAGSASEGGAVGAER